MPLSHPYRRKRLADRGHQFTIEALGAAEALEPRQLLAADASLPLVVLAVADADCAELDSNQGRFTITRFGSTDSPLTVQFQIGGTATPGTDYIAHSGQVTIPAGRRAVSLPVIPIDDLDVEGNETVRVILSRNDSVYRLDESNVLNRNLAITIRDNDVLPVVTLNMPDGWANEVNGDTATITIRRTGPKGLPLTVSLLISGSATPGVDYEALPTTVTIQAGKRAAFLVIRPINDALFEGNETVRVRLAPSEGGQYALKPEEPARVRRMARILDRPLVMLAVTDPLGTSEPDDTAEFTVFRTGPTSGELRVSYLLEGTATAGVDYERLGQFIVIPAGQSFTRVTITGLGGQLSSPIKTVRLTLRPQAGYNLNLGDLGTVSAYVRLIDDGVPPGV